MPVIEIQNLKKYFGKTRAVDGISIDVKESEIYGFLGPNGAGKSTTIRCMMDIIRPMEGNVTIFGKNSRRDSVELKKRIGYLPGGSRFKDNWTGRDHINFVRDLQKCDNNADELITRLNFNASLKARHLSLGNCQKLGIILAFMSKPDLLILDEPTLGLDPLFQNVVYELLSEANQRGATIFMSSHNLSDVERICHRVGIIKEGKMVADESISTLKQKRLYRVWAHFTGKFDKNEFAIEGVQIKRFSTNYLELDVKGDITPVIAKLGKYELHDLQVEHASLKDIFMEFYEE